MQTSVTVPESFDADDILHFIYLEQARFFPMLERDIYFDFSVLEVLNGEKSLRIFACNKKTLQPLESIFLELNVEWRKLCVDHEDYSYLNFLPWRQEEKNRIKNKNQSMIIFFFCYIHEHCHAVLLRYCFLLCV
ncbi:MAG: hypothetical protein LRY69_05235 [Gammaproteobacteria bacterium]|nr:hypothetical protein [Gammaproteobacteria bacterium]